MTARIRDVPNRFRRDAFYMALDSKRAREGVSWRDVARETGVAPSTFSRLARGSDPDMRTFAALAAWLKLDVRPFFLGAQGYASPRAADIRLQVDATHEAVRRLASLVLP